MILRKIRIALAILVFTLLTFYFLDFAHLLPARFRFLAEIQFVPALLSGSIAVFLALLLLTLFCGRIYCSVICPLGIFQDIISWFSKRFKHKKKYTYSKEKRILRYSLLIAVIIFFFAGGAVLLSLLDPYGAFGRMVTNVFRPVYMAGNNLLANLFNHFENYTFYTVDINILSLFSLIIGLVTFLVTGFLAWKYGRTYCNTICPVGSFLGLISRYSFIKVRIKNETCNSCGLCEMSCKASCIDSKNKIIDHSRCVDCYNCLNVCKKNALSYRFAAKKKIFTDVIASNSRTDVIPLRDDIRKNYQTDAITPNNQTDVIPSRDDIRKIASSDDICKSNHPNESKRLFLATIAATALAVPGKLYAKNLAKVKTNTAYEKKHPLSPPGSESAEHFLKHCTACHLCVAKCPSHILKPAFTEYGLGGIMQPRMDFRDGFCNYNCTVCSHVCPNGAIKKLTRQEKHELQVGKVHFVKNNCVVFTDETSCGACSEHCPTQAVKMVPYKNGLTIPSVDTDICVGCGGCEHICPVRPYRAIYVEGNPVHLKAKPFEKEKKEDVHLEGFGF